MAKPSGAVWPGTLDRVLAEIAAGETYPESNEDLRSGPDDDR